MESKKSSVSNKKGKKVISRNKLFLIIIVIVIILCFVIGAIVLNTKDDSKSGADGKVDNSQGDSADGTIVDGSAGTIDLNNKENATVNNGVKENNCYHLY